MSHMVKMKMGILLIVSLTILVSCTKNGSLSHNEKVQVQGAMKEYVDARLLKDEDIYVIEDVEGKFDYLHEGVKRKDDLYISCADVKAGNDVYDIDYYVKAESGKFIVIKEVLHKVNKKEINRTLWEND